MTVPTHQCPSCDAELMPTDNGTVVCANLGCGKPGCRFCMDIRQRMTVFKIPGDKWEITHFYKTKYYFHKEARTL